MRSKRNPRTAKETAARTEPAGGAMGKFAVITLGCAKNKVDSEVLAGILRRDGIEITSDINEAEVAVINTCGFLQSAAKEAVDVILDVSQLKRGGRLRKIIVAGCLVERYGQELKESLPEVDLFMGVDDIPRITDLVRAGTGAQLLPRPAPNFLYDHSMPRALDDLPFAYVKIADGCNRRCAFCTIPSIRGPYRSRAPESIIAEVKRLGSLGIKEVNLVAQDSSAFGVDLQPQRSIDLARLLESLDAVSSVPWKRVRYTYPVGINDRLLDALTHLPTVCEYLDLPLQHSSETVLRAMQRPIGRFASRRIVEKIRCRAPALSLRTTFIVGYPGEREKDVDDLERFIGEGHFSSVAMFIYSPEEGTAAFDLKGVIPLREKRRRLKRLVRAQQRANKAKLRGYIGKDLEVLIEGPHAESDMLLAGRTRFQAPEVDGAVIVNDILCGMDKVSRGVLTRVEITGIAGYDLVGTVKECL